MGIDPAKPHAFRVSSGIRNLTPEQANKLRAQLSRHQLYFHRLYRRLIAMGFLHNRETAQMITSVARAKRDITDATWSTFTAGVVHPAADAEAWLGDGI